MYVLYSFSIFTIISEQKRGGCFPPFVGNIKDLKKKKQGEESTMIRILIVDHLSVVREGLRVFLKCDPTFDVVGEAANGAEAIEKAHNLRPDIVLLDLLLPIVDGTTATATIRRELPETQVIVLTSQVDRSSVIGAIRAGASGYLCKDTQADELCQAINAVSMGQISLSPQASTYLLREVRASERSEPLTERETDVLRQLVLGRSNKEIAQALQIAEDTVKTHVRHILVKLDVQSRTQAILVALRLKLVDQNSTLVRD